jgi:hypothetical protein
VNVDRFAADDPELGFACPVQFADGVFFAFLLSGNGERIPPLFFSFLPQ